MFAVSSVDEVGSRSMGSVSCELSCGGGWSCGWVVGGAGGGCLSAEW